MTNERDEATVEPQKCCETCKWWTRWSDGENLGDCTCPLPCWSEDSDDDGYQPTGRLYGSACEAWQQRGAE